MFLYFVHRIALSLWQLNLTPHSERQSGYLFIPVPRAAHSHRCGCRPYPWMPRNMFCTADAVWDPNDHVGFFLRSWPPW